MEQPQEFFPSAEESATPDNNENSVEATSTPEVTVEGLLTNFEEACTQLGIKETPEMKAIREGEDSTESRTAYLDLAMAEAEKYTEDIPFRRAKLGVKLAQASLRFQHGSYQQVVDDLQDAIEDAGNDVVESPEQENDRAFFPEEIDYLYYLYDCANVVLSESL